MLKRLQSLLSPSGPDTTDAAHPLDEALCRQIVDTAYEGVWLIDNEGRTTFANPRMAAMLGYSPEDMLGRTMYDFMEAEERVAAQANLSRRRHGVSEQHDFRFLRRDGSDLWTSIAASPLVDRSGKVIGALGLVSDISERKQAEEHLQRLTRWYTVSIGVNEVIVRERDPQRLYEYACRVAVEQGLMRLAWIGVWETGRQQITPVARFGRDEGYVDRVSQQLLRDGGPPGPARRAFHTGSHSVSNDIRLDDAFQSKREAQDRGFRSCAVFPIKIRQQPVGVMALYSDQLGYFNDAELRVLNALVDDISFAVESAQQEEERRRSDAALREHERAMSTLLSNLDGMACRERFDEQWTAELISDGCRKITGYAPEDLIDNRVISLEQLIHPQDRQRVREQVAAAVQTRQQFEIEYRIVTAGGQVRWLWERGLGVFDEAGQLSFIEGFATDVTERHLAEKRIAEQAALLDKAKDAILLRGLNGQVNYWNKGAERLYGWSQHEAVGHNVRELIYDEPQGFEQAQRVLLADGEWSGDLTQRCKDGRRIVVESSWTLLRDEHGTPQSVLAINSDVTEKRQLEAQLLRAQRMESIGTLAGGIAHDFNNILAAITGNTRLAIADLPDTHPARESLQEVEKASRRAAGVVRQILSFSQPQETSRQVIPLQPVIDEALGLLRATLPAMIQIRPELSANAPDVLADAVQIHQVIMNLGTNAAHAMREHGGIIEVRLDDATLDATHDLTPSLPAGRYARLTISDAGAGMSQPTLDRIFEPFFTTKPPGQGTGLGLAVVHGIANSHGASIGVSSQPGQGAIFTLHFPAADRPAEDASVSEAATAKGSGKRILYIDDEEALVFLTTRALERLGYRVTGSTDALEALAMFRENPSGFDAVVTDLSMPGMSGTDLARAILELQPALPVVMMSGYVRPEDTELAQQAGIRRVILKPNTVEELGRQLHELLQNS